MKQEVQPHGGTLTRPDKGETANPNGRPPKGFRGFARYFKEQGYEEVSEAMVREAYMMLLDLPASEVLKIAGNPVTEFKQGDVANQAPAVLRMVAQQFFGKRGQEMLKQVMDRAFGTATSNVDIKSDGERISPLAGVDPVGQAEILRILQRKNAEPVN